MAPTSFAQALQALSVLDYILIAAYIAFTLLIAARFSKRAGSGIGEFFLSGRNLPWYIAGVSMVATTFAADTPLAVTELVNDKGISGNWLWWNMLAGGMLTTFFFAKLWRRAGLTTDNEFAELRYGGKPALGLRVFKGVYLGLFVNAIIMGWVHLAMHSILMGFFGIDRDTAFWVVVGLMVLTTLYTGASGLWGVAVTDFFQFFLAMGGCIVLAFYVLNHPAVGGIEGLKAQLPPGAISFFPAVEADNGLAGTGKALTIGLLSFLSFAAVQWWASYYPGNEPGGGGYVAQRILSSKNESHAFRATLFFQVMHYCLRPWPWIVVGLATILIYPDPAGLEGDALAEHHRLKYVWAMRDLLPSGVKGLLLVAFLAAYMSTIGTQLNWGASYLVMDVYRRAVRKPESFGSERAAERHYVWASRSATLLAMLASLVAVGYMHSISGVWRFLLEAGAGLGFVLILRWYWWRINVWSEITAMVFPAVVYGLLLVLRSRYPETEMYQFPSSYLITVGATVLAIVAVTLLTPPESQKVLHDFYVKIRPGGWWRPISQAHGLSVQNLSLGYLLPSWLFSVMGTYFVLFGTGHLLFHNYLKAALFLGGAAVAIAMGVWLWRKGRG